jgi:benzodiazapine receptor
MARMDEEKRSAKRGLVRSIAALGVFAGLTAAAAMIGKKSVRRSDVRWYRRLEKPGFAPSARLFRPAGPGLHALMALSAHRVQRAPKSRRRNAALGLWGAQLLLDAAWTPLVFRTRKPLAGLAGAVALAGAATAYTVAARGVDKHAARMMLPYLGWLGYIGLTNAEIVRRNR